MLIYKAYQFRLYPSVEQKNKLNQNLGSSRFIYNYYLDKRQTVYKENAKTISLLDRKKELVHLQKEYPWLKEVDSCVLRTSLDDLDKKEQSKIISRAAKYRNGSVEGENSMKQKYQVARLGYVF